MQRIKLLSNTRVDIKKRKWKVMTSHMARRIFITQCLERGIAPEIVMKYTGHRDTRTMMIYVGMTERTKYDEMEKWNVNR